MMRELKVSGTLEYQTLNHGCSGNPYDEGTESFIELSLACKLVFVAAEIPMMRELKGPLCHLLQNQMFCCSGNPYDEGTERIFIDNPPFILFLLQRKSL